MSDLSSTQDEPVRNLHRLQQIRYKFIQMRYAYYCFHATKTALLRCVSLPWRMWYALFSDNTSCSAIAACQRS